MSRAWIIVALLMPVALLNYLDRQMLASVKTSVMGDISDIGTQEKWGLMLGQFKWFYAFCSPIGGLLADFFGRRWTICGSLIVWSAITWATGHVSSYEGLLWTRSLMGISEAFYIPAALALIADYHASDTRSKAVGFHQMAIYCGVIVGGFAGFVADQPSLGWRWAFNACGIFGIAYAVPLMLILRDKPRAPLATKSQGPDLASTFSLLKVPSFYLLVLYFTLPALAGWVVRDWMPAILKEEFNLKQGWAGVWATLPWQLAAIIGVGIGGWWADRLMQRTIRGRIYISALGMGLIIPAILGIGHALTLAMAITCLVFFGLGWGFFDGNNMPILSQIAAPHQRATGYGLMNFASISAGGLADWGFGKLRDNKVPLDVIFGSFAGLAVVSAVLVLLIKPNPNLSGEGQEN